MESRDRGIVSHVTPVWGSSCPAVGGKTDQPFPSLQVFQGPLAPQVLTTSSKVTQGFLAPRVPQV